MAARPRSAQQAVSADHRATLEVTHDQVFAMGIEFVDIETTRVGTFKTPVELEVKNLKPESLCLFDLFCRGCDLDFEVRHPVKKLTQESPFVKSKALKET
jgi:hypothetical protein